MYRLAGNETMDNMDSGRAGLYRTLGHLLRRGNEITSCRGVFDRDASDLPGYGRSSGSSNRLQTAIQFLLVGKVDER